MLYLLLHEIDAIVQQETCKNGEFNRHTKQIKLSLEMGPIQVGRKRLSRGFGAVEQAKNDPQGDKDDDGQWKSKEGPGAKAHRFCLREVRLPHTHQDKVHAGTRQGAHATNCCRVYDSQRQSFGEACDVGVGRGA